MSGQDFYVINSHNKYQKRHSLDRDVSRFRSIERARISISARAMLRTAATGNTLLIEEAVERRHSQMQTEDVRRTSAEQFSRAWKKLRECDLTPMAAALSACSTRTLAQTDSACLDGLAGDSGHGPSQDPQHSLESRVPAKNRCFARFLNAIASIPHLDCAEGRCRSRQ
jgi:hypothetical protein